VSEELLDGAWVGGAPATRDGDRVVAGGRSVGRVHADERRIEWSYPVGAILAPRVRAERALFDAHAPEGTVDPEPAAEAAAWLDASPRVTPALGRALRGIALPIEGARVLELGGSGEATRGFLAAGARRVDQLDVSPAMHGRARSRLTEAERARVVQHTAPGERTPFGDDTFDAVFSRHCVHHMRRPDVFEEARRVLRPGGWLLFIEPFFPDPVRAAMKLRRRARAAERGTDDPLGGEDLRALRRVFEGARVVGEPSVRAYVRGARPLRRLAARARDWLPGPLVRAVGGRVVVIVPPQGPASSHAGSSVA